jgi:hypothetical protein
MSWDDDCEAAETSCNYECEDFCSDLEIEDERLECEEECLGECMADSCGGEYVDEL